MRNLEINVAKGYKFYINNIIKLLKKKKDLNQSRDMLFLWMKVSISQRYQFF